MDRQSWLGGTLYRPEFEQDSCGFGLIAQMDNKPSHWLVKTAISSLASLTHRGAVAADGKSGDGCGLLFGKPDSFLRTVARELGFTLDALYAAGLVFVGQDESVGAASLKTLQQTLQDQGLSVAGVRVVPIDIEACGEYALRTLPAIKQIFVNAPADMAQDDFERKLYQARRMAEKENRNSDPAFYIPTLNSQTLSYKGLVTPENLPVFYRDLQDPRFESALAVYHQRFSTNTWPQWKLAQPFRFLAHNGEINTLMGNRLWAKAREAIMHSEHLDMQAVRPIVQTDGSDSMSLDNMLEGLMLGGMDVFRAFRMLVPPAWQNVDNNDRDLRAFYEYNSMHMEAWDGPAGIVWTTGQYAGCMLDRNGLRPARYVITKDRHFTVASEIGVWNYKPEDVVKKGRVKPGQIVAVDMQTGEFLDTETIDGRLKNTHPYRKWIKKNAIQLELAEDSSPLPEMGKSELLIFQKQFQLTFEERDQILRVLAADGQEAVGSMGDDTPMAVLSEKVRSPFDYLRQQFAQVTNPPIDPIREAIVMSLNTCFGPERNVFSVTEDNAKRLEVRSPVLSSDKFDALTSLPGDDYKPFIFDITYDPKQHNLQQAVQHLQDQVLASVRNDRTVIVVLSDKHIAAGRLPIHALFATGAVHHALVNAGLRCKINLVVETATARDPHHFACLIGYGATAVFPYLAYQTIKELVDTGAIEYPLEKAANNFRKAINKGLLKILSKMGISTVASYRGAQLFEAVGIGEEVIKQCMVGTVSRIGGATFSDFEADALRLNKLAFNPMRPIQQGGLLKYVFGEEYHAYNPDVVMQLQKAVQNGDYKDYLRYAELVNKRPVAMLRDLMSLKLDDHRAIPLEEVESEAAILARFDSAGMSLGALSPEAHEALAEGMNRLGGRSNSGEGGEDPARYGTLKMSKIKQVASGRFGVTPHYLVNAEVLQIKVAQGAKPGEGGQLPGDKVSPLIARLRCSKPGISLISPPPHHDIYSIEDLAQLIFDLKQVNPAAYVSVKLVAEPGVGTIAAGVAKAYADLITISGYDGGTGASPLTSVKYAGTPFELGLTEAQQVLRANGLRGRVRVQTDGGLKTGLDVVKAAMMGAESFGFGTGPMVALGCKYLRICHLNNCATGVATQEIKLRSKYFIGLPDMVVNYFTFIARETREWMAKLGVRSMAELIGRSDLLALAEGATERQKKLRLDVLLSQGSIPESEPRYCTQDRNPSFDKGELAERMVADAIAGIHSKAKQRFEYPVSNVNRSIGARLSGEIAKAHGAAGLPDDSLHIKLYGSAGQSLGVWNAAGLTLELEGDANDYVGKGMAGGRVVIYPPKVSEFAAHDAVIVGNTCLYGATGGELYAAGRAGERFAVRNSGALAVVEGVGDHGCEYMTGGTVIVLGETGYNFGAGMTGGFALVYDPVEKFAYRYNNELVDINLINGEAYGAVRAFLKARLKAHLAQTGSARAQAMLEDFDEAVDNVWLVKPKAAKLDDLLKD